MTTAIQLRHASPKVQEILDNLDDEDLGRIQGFLLKVNDYRGMWSRGERAAAARYHDTLLSEIQQLRERSSDLTTNTALAAGAGAAAGAWLFGIGAVAGGLAGGAVGYFAAKDRKESMLQVCDALLVELGPRPG
jgi:hypothetical protein